MVRFRTDRVLFLTVLAMVAFGIVMLYSASSVLAELRFDKPPYYFVIRQFAWAVLSFFVLMKFRQFDYRKLNTPAWAFTGLGVVLALLLIVYVVDMDDHRWFRVPGVGSLQPSEFAKPALVLFLAYFIARRKESLNDKRTLLQAGVAIAMLAFLVVVSDLGTAMVPVITAIAVLWIAGLERRVMLRVIGIGLLLATLAIASRPYRLGRVIAYLDPDYSVIEKIDTSGVIRAFVARNTTVSNPNYQALQSKVAIGAGGILGAGLMQGKQKLMFLPEAHNDFIYATIGEELGLWGASALLAGYLVILWRGTRLFLVARDSFGKYLALGVTVSIVVQALLNISVALDMVPTKGFPLPLISGGGSSLLSTLSSLGMLLSVSEHEG